jgi:hypothetical protein
MGWGCVRISSQVCTPAPSPWLQRVQRDVGVKQRSERLQHQGREALQLIVQPQRGQLLRCARGEALLLVLDETCERLQRRQQCVRGLG